MTIVGRSLGSGAFGSPLPALGLSEHVPSSARPPGRGRPGLRVLCL